MEIYHTIYKGGNGEIVEKKSRFIAEVHPVTSEEEAMEILEQTRKQYWDARHHCWAYIIGRNPAAERMSDDGEPAGTAGKPILDIIMKSGIYNCLIIVTRYFGGTLLGTGGLIRAYQAASKEGLEHSTVLSVSDGVLAQIDADYNSIGKIQYICSETDIDILKTEYTENVYMEMIVQAENYGQFVQKITDAFSGKISVVKIQQQKFGKSESGEVILLS